MNASAVSRVSATASLLKEGSRRTLTNRSPYRRDAAGSQWLETECFPSVTALQAATAKQEASGWCSSVSYIRRRKVSVRASSLPGHCQRRRVKKAPVKGPISLAVVMMVMLVMMVMRVAGKSRDCDSQGEKCSEDIGE